MSKVTDKLAGMMDFPCQYTLKVVGLATDAFPIAVIGVVQSISPGDYVPKITPSKTGKYHSLTLSIKLNNKDQLESLYTKVSALPEVKMVI